MSLRVLLLVFLAAASAVRIGVVGATPPASRDSDASRAAFAVMDRVLTSPRCQNCHTLTGFPRQNDDRHPHRFNVTRGPDGHGAPGLPCRACHGRANNAASGVPGGDEDWRLAPIGMGWEGLSPGLRCAHLKDPKRNGGRSGADVIDHLKTHLVAWAWSPGTDAHGKARTAPPVSQADFLLAAERWVATGEACPGIPE
jgi:hypothetical protein